MIEMFKENEMRNSGVVYNSVFEQIKQLYEVDPEKAGELAISAIELVLTGDISSDDMMINMLLTPIKKINENNQIKYDNKVENQRQKKLIEMKLDKIADLANRGYKQRQIGEKLNLSQQMVSYRMNVIKQNYPELLKIDDTNKIQNSTNKIQNTKDEIFVEANEETEVVYTKDFKF